MNTINWREVMYDLNTIKERLNVIECNISPSNKNIEYICNRFLMGHNLDLNEKQFDLNYRSVCVTIKEVDGAYQIIGNVEVYDEEGHFITILPIEKIVDNCIEQTHKEINEMWKNIINPCK